MLYSEYNKGPIKIYRLKKVLFLLRIQHACWSGLSLHNVGAVALWPGLACNTLGSESDFIVDLTGNTVTEIAKYHMFFFSIYSSAKDICVQVGHAQIKSRSEMRRRRKEGRA